MGKTWNISSCIIIKSLISSAYSSLVSSDLVRGRRERLSIAVYFILEIYRTSKSNKRIHASHLVIKTLKRSAPDRFNWIIRILTSIFRMKCTLYSYMRTFLIRFKFRDILVLSRCIFTQQDFIVYSYNKQAFVYLRPFI